MSKDRLPQNSFPSIHFSALNYKCVHSLAKHLKSITQYKCLGVFIKIISI